MKRLLVLTITSLLLSATIAKAEVLNFIDAYKQSKSKPFVILIYANWVQDYESYVQQFRNIQKEFGNKYNYVELNIADEDAKDYNQKFIFDRDIPYVVFYRNGCKISRFMDRSCASSSACMIQKIKAFTH